MQGVGQWPLVGRFFIIVIWGRESIRLKCRCSGGESYGGGRTLHLHFHRLKHAHQNKENNENRTLSTRVRTHDKHRL